MKEKVDKIKAYKFNQEVENYILNLSSYSGKDILNKFRVYRIDIDVKKKVAHFSFMHRKNINDFINFYIRSEYDTLPKMVKDRLFIPNIDFLDSLITHILFTPEDVSYKDVVNGKWNIHYKSSAKTFNCKDFNFFSMKKYYEKWKSNASGTADYFSTMYLKKVIEYRTIMYNNR